jgi:hypothetical protein
MAASSLVGVVLGLLGIYLVKRLLTTKRGLAPLPPGPKGKPIVGNLRDLPGPGTQEWQHWLKHKDLYGMSGQGLLRFALSECRLLRRAF